jgi:hypothetical protein
LAGGSVAIVRFQAVAAGTTSVLITDVVAKDVEGRPIASAISASNLQVTVDSPPPPLPGTRRERRAAAAEPPAESSEAGD